ncbi:MULTISPECIES: hypothetical protein [Sphingobium]|uniref:hypothetical protein n=1 Tax=Sphingobium TaxID=165695 RepID=UPI0007F4E4F5|nr:MULTISPECIES: hypothetical protein [Sphingobium]OAN51850.1 hypothetical protein A7Q26_09155 [Sphingobium sp. TCM1]QWT15321.1 hypothetical protein GTV57_06160 [Sphingobium xenophagum]
MAKLASKSFLLSQKPRSSELFIPEWDATVRLEAFTVERRIAFISVLQENAEAIRLHKEDPTNHPAVDQLDEALVGLVYSIVDANGNLMFDLSDIPQLKGLPYTQIQHIYLHMVSLSYANGDIVRDVEAEKKG